MDYKEKKDSYASDNEKKYKEKEYVIEKQEDGKQKPSLPTFQEMFYKIPSSGSIVSFSDFHDGIIYFSSLDSHVYAVDSERGEMVWKFKTGAPVISTPLVHNSRIYVGSNDEHFYCLNMDGTLLWRKHLGDIIVSSPTAVGDKVFIANGKGNLFCFSPEGYEIWRFKTGDGIISFPSITNDLVFIGSYDRSLYAIDMDGRLRWKFTAGERIGSPHIMDNGKRLFSHYTKSWEKMPEAGNPALYCGSYDNNVYALDIDGSIIWKFNCGTSVPGIIEGSDGTVYAGTISGSVIALDAFEGHQKWGFRQSGIVLSGVYPKDGRIFFGSMDQNIYCLKEDGTKEWAFLTGGPVICLPYVTGGKIYFGSSDTFFYCIDIKDRSIEWKFQVGFGLSDTIRKIANEYVNAFIEYDRKIFKVWKPETAAARAANIPMMSGYNIPQGFSFGGESVYKSTGVYKSEPVYKDKKSPYKK